MRLAALRGRLAGLLSGLLAITAIAIAGPASTAAAAHPSRRHPSSPLPVTGMKPILAGLLDRKGAPPASSASRVNGFVVNVGWSVLQPDAGGPIVAHNPIDAAVEAIRSQPSLAGQQIKLRVMAGPQAPAWAKQLGGPPVAIGGSDSIGRFWTPEFGAAYADLEDKLAAEYDGTPELAQIEISRCMLTTAEPLLRQGSTPSVPSALLDAGYTADADDACQREEIEAHEVWQHTRSGIALNPYQRVEPDGTVKGDEGYTESIMQYCRATLGSRCVLENNSVRWPQQPDPYPQMYAAMKSMGSPIGFQTAASNRIGDAMQALDFAVSEGANSIELNRDYPSYDPTQLQQVQADLTGTVTGGGGATTTTSTTSTTTPAGSGGGTHHHHHTKHHHHHHNHKPT